VSVGVGDGLALLGVVGVVVAVADLVGLLVVL
jgi:hypothetical protein